MRDATAAPSISPTVFALEMAQMQHLITSFDFSSDEILNCFDRASRLKAAYLRGDRSPRYPQRVMALLFEKPSLRTRVSFEAAMVHLGGTSIYLGSDVGWGTRESIADFATVLGNYVDIIVCRTFAHDRVVELATHSSAPVINGLTDSFHPCQALTDLFTLSEHFESLNGRKMAFVGDANNVARSLAIVCAKLDVALTIASPERYQLDQEFLKQLRQELPAAQIELTDDPKAAVADADVVYTDVWASMGQEEEQAKRKVAFAEFQVNSDLMRAASAQAVFMHCLPAHRGEEVTDDVLDGPQSIAMIQAENRMHLQKGVLDRLLENARPSTSACQLPTRSQ